MNDSICMFVVIIKSVCIEMECNFVACYHPGYHPTAPTLPCIFGKFICLFHFIFIYSSAVDVGIEQLAIMCSANRSGNMA